MYVIYLLHLLKTNGCLVLGVFAQQEKLTGWLSS